jgi:F0F1-type ATP synthase delta subunit
MKQENIKKLQDDLDLLIEKHSQCIKNNDFGAALNIMKNIDYLTSQLKHVDYEQMISKYYIEDSGKRKQLISIWKQNAFGNVKDHETYVIKEKYTDNTYDALEKLSNSWNTMPEETKAEVYKIFGANITDAKITL